MTRQEATARMHAAMDNSPPSHAGPDQDAPRIAISARGREGQP